MTAKQAYAVFLFAMALVVVACVVFDSPLLFVGFAVGVPLGMIVLGPARR